jgi:alpha-tubulin suppressor-like RCC1 family protein
MTRPAAAALGIVFAAGVLCDAVPIQASATTSSSIVYAWGDNYSGELGCGACSPYAGRTPLHVGGLTGVTALAAGFAHSLALKSDGTVWAWGYNANGELGNGSTNNSGAPVRVTGLTGMTAVAGGGGHSLALNSDGTVWAWGSNSSGQLGNGSATGTFAGSNTPVQATGLTGMTAVAGGEHHSLALKSDGTVWAWGDNAHGQLGTGSTTGPQTCDYGLACSTTAVQVSGLTGVTAVSAGAVHSLALKSDGTVWAWGFNREGELGNGSTTNSSTPVQVTGLTGMTAIAGGGFHNLALKSDGTVWAWGSNDHGQLGNGSAITSSTPVQVTGLTGMTAIAAGFAYGLGLRSDGTVWAWGDNSYGQLGNGSTTDSSTPVQVSRLVGAADIAAGAAHSLALGTPPPDRTKTTVGCTPNPVRMNNPTTCTATVSDPVTPADTPTGTVTWSGGVGTFSSSTCTLSAGRCSVTFTPAPGSPSTQAITASYGGDGSHAPRNGVMTLHVRP